MTAKASAGMDPITVAPATVAPVPYEDDGGLFAGEDAALAAALAEARAEAPAEKPAAKPKEPKAPAETKAKPEEKAEPKPKDEATEEPKKDDVAEPEKEEPEAPAEPAKPEGPLGAARASLARRTAKFETERAASRAEMAAREQHIQQRETSLRAQETTIQHAQSVIESAKRDPLGFLSQLGITAELLNRRILNDGKPSAEETAEVALREARAMKEEARRDREATAQAQQRAQQAANVQAAEQSFVKEAQSKALYPTLNAANEKGEPLFTADELVAAGYEVARLAKAKTGRTYSDAQILEYLEHRESRRYGVGTGKQASGPGGGNTANGVGSQGTRAAGTSGPTLTNRTNASRASIPKPIELQDEEEERATLLAAIAASRR